MLAPRNGVTHGRTFVVSVRGILRGVLVLVESRLASVVIIFGRKWEGRKHDHTDLVQMHSA